MQNDDHARARITQIFRYLEELNRRRNPLIRSINEQPWKMRLLDVPVCPAVLFEQSLPTEPEDSAEPSSVASVASSSTAIDAATEAEFVLKVGRSQITDAPPPPDNLKGWLLPGWDDPTKSVEILPYQELIVDGEVSLTTFDEEMELKKSLADWQGLHEAWAVTERPARIARKLFEDLYGVYGQLERESERFELVLGDGLLRWSHSDGIVNHPILLQRVLLRFDPQKPEFTISRADQPVELYSALFRGMAGLDGAVIGKCRAELEQGQFDPLDNSVTMAFLRRVVTQLSPRGELREVSSAKAAGADPVISRDPYIFLRRRTLGYATAVEAILTNLRQDAELPPSLVNLVGIEANYSPASSEIPKATPRPAASDESILLSKPANQEQIEIAQRLESHGCVLVQGPPGTGKTHTIANLVGHLLAQGKSILVTSHTTKALRVLRQQIVPQLQPLCVSVLDGGEESRQQLEASVAGIVERLSGTDAETLTRQSESLTGERHGLKAVQQTLTEELQRSLFDEYREIVVAGRSFAPSEAARRVASGHGQDDWIPSPVVPDSPLPLTTTEILALYRTNVTLTAQDEIEIAGRLPQIDYLVPPAEFVRFLQERQQLEKTNLRLSAELWRAVKSDPTPEAINALQQAAISAVSLMNQGTQWQSAAIESGRSGGAQRETWENLLALMDKTVQEASAAQNTQMQHGPVLAKDRALEEQVRLLDEIISHLQNGKPLSRLTMLTHGDWKKFIAEVRVGDRMPATLDHFKALHQTAQLEINRAQLTQWWERLMVPLGGIDIKGLNVPPEQACRQYKALILEALDWYKSIWLPITQDFHNIGFNWPGLLQTVSLNFAPSGELLRLRDAVLQHLPPVFQSRMNFRRAQIINAKLHSVIRYLDSLREQNTAPVVIQMREALNRWDVKSYQAAHERLVELNRKSADLALRHKLLGQLEVLAPTWAIAVRDRCEPHHQRDLPGNAEDAWIWRQLNDELERRNQVSLDVIQQKLTKTGIHLQEITAELVDRLAWAAQIRRTTLAQRQSLMGWLQIIRRIGKGTGKRVPKLQAEARNLMAQAQSSVPVWIMPLTRVVESFDPSKAKFDVVIIDEASQSDVMGLIAFYLGKQIVVVGDDQQVSPDAVGEQLDETDNLIAEHLTDIPNAILYDGKQSIYDLATQSFGGTICLREHFRCVTDIIQFSNRLSYQGNIKPLRDESSVVTKPYTLEYRVEGAVSNSKVNQQEALVVASLIAAAVEQPEYAEQTFGAISLVGEEQARRIETLLREHLPPIDYEQRRMMCGTPPQFQGDERDIMFLSVVDAPQNGPLALRQQPLFKKRFNVAASRARNQMWVVHSLNSEIDLKPGDLRRLLIEHARNPQAFEDQLRDKAEKTDSNFERQVLRRLMTAGYQVVPQWKVGYYRIDLVVEGNGKRLAVECDGDRFHTMDNLADDMQRQAILERLGWTFVRIRGSEFYRNPDQAMVPVFDRLAQMEILPTAEEVVEGAASNPEPQSNELYNRVVLRAALLRREWSGENDDLFGETNAPEYIELKGHTVSMPLTF